MSIDKLKDWFEKNKDQNLSDYFELLKFKSISSDPEYKDDIFKCASWLEKYIKNMGLSSEIIQTPVYPIVFGEYKKDDSLPTVLLYGHYDVQPITPIEEWKTDPFEPTIIDNVVYARGASDDKGQLFYTLLALKARMEIFKELPVNIKICLEGEEEFNSTGLSKSLDSLKEKLKADSLMVVDLFIPDADTPAISLGARGMCALSVELQGSSVDLHSGEFGGIAYNPLQAAVDVLSKLKDEKSKVLVDHFYDDVIEMSEDEKKIFDFDFDKKSYEEKFGIKAFDGEEGFSPIESNWIRPTLEINGIGGGFFEQGFKTVIPSKVIIKLSCRLVPNQDPDKIAKLIKEFLEKNIEKGIDIKIKLEGGGFALKGDNNSKIAKATSKAYEEVFNKPCKRILAGGSIPVIAQMIKVLSCEVVGLGTAIAEDNIHAPNEHFGLDRFEKGFYVIAKTLENL